MFTEICQYLRNWFTRAVTVGLVTISGGVISVDGDALALMDGQYYRIIGSIMNDGVHKYGDTSDELTDEEFAGAVWSMAIPPDVVKLVGEIEAWVTANNAAISSPFASESFGGYSYSLRTSSGADGQTTAPTWQSQFAARLAPWRRI